MLVAVFSTFAASRKEPLGEVIKRVHQGFLAAGFGEPRILGAETLARIGAVCASGWVDCDAQHQITDDVELDGRRG
jgi:hypothetical protein